MKKDGSTQWICRMAIAIIFFCLSACSLNHGGDEPDSDEDGIKTLSGTVSAGAPVQGVVILRKASSDTPQVKTYAIDVDGHFSIDVSGITEPYVLQARGTVGGRSFCLHSIGVRGDMTTTVNITPFTNLVVGNILGKDPEEYFESFTSPVLTDVATETNINKHESLVRSRFKSVFQLFGVDFANVNLISTPFNADHTGVDGVLDFIRFIPSWDENSRKMPQMTAKLLFSDDEIVDDFTIETDISVLAAPETLLDAKAAMLSITGVFKKWTDLFSDDAAGDVKDNETKLKTKAAPQSDNADLVALFSSDFLQNGFDRTGFLGKICDNVDTLESMKISGLALERLDLIAGKAVVSFTVTNSSKISEDQYNWELIKQGGAWLISGNHQRLDCFVGSYAAYSETTKAIIANGLCIYASTPFIQETEYIDHIVVSGPGIMDQLVLSRVENEDLVLFIPDGSSPQGYYQPDEPTEVKENGEYVFLLYDAENNRITENEYKRYLKRGNISSDELLAKKSSIFCNITKPYQDLINTFNGEATLECQWTTPAYMTLKEINYYYNHSGVDTNKRTLFSDDKSSDFKSIQEKNITRIDIYVRCMDAYDRAFDTFLSDSDYTTGTKAKNIIFYGIKNGKESTYPYKIF